jgi:tetratricopeptide (TPR) repeat protein
MLALTKPLRHTVSSAMRRLTRGLALCVALCLLALPVHAQETDYGSTHFPNSGAETAQEPFLRGLLMLHSFEYDDARAAFQKAQEIDPHFVMAYWGEAMTHNHPIWMEQDRTAALKALRDLAPTPKARLQRAPTAREKAYLRTIHILYGAGTEDPRSKEARDDAYENAIADLAEQYPKDLNAQSFRALAILGTAHEGRDFETYMRAAAIVEEVFDENPQHPGAAHYLIHAYDDPVHASLGLRPARVYADIAPAAPHALHMPSHIFFALGQWTRGADSNVDSYEAAKAETVANGKPLGGSGFHALHWLHYAHLQQGHYEEARSVVNTTQTHAIHSNVETGYATYMRWYMPVAYVVETERWGQFDERLGAMTIAADSLDTRGAITLHAGRGLAAAQQGDLPTARSALAKAEDALGESDSKALRIQVRELKGLIALKANETDTALKHLKRAAALESERPLDFGPPFPPKPAPELYGEALLSVDRPADALTQFRTALDRYPGRALSLLGKAMSAAAAGKPDVAQEARSALAAQWKNADPKARRRLQSVADAPDAGTAESK